MKIANKIQPERITARSPPKTNEPCLSGLSGLLSCALVTVLGLSNGLADQRYLHCDKDVAETALIGDCGHIYAHGSGSDRR